MLNSKLAKRFDIFNKTIDGVRGQQTVLGALITISTCIIVLILFTTEIISYSKSSFTNKMVLDNSIGSVDVEIFFDVEFPRIPCHKINYVQEVTRGNIHSHEPDLIAKDPIEGGIGCRVHGVTVTDKATGSFRFMVDPPPIELFLNANFPSDRVDDLR
jgi:hypothetical protein